MKSFFLRPGKSRVVASFIFATLTSLIVGVSITVSNYSNWKSSVEKFQNFNPALTGICLQLEKEVEKMDRFEWRTSEDRLTKSGCPFSFLFGMQPPKLEIPKNPGVFADIFWNSISIEKITVFYFAITFVIWLITQIIHDLLKIQHLGWKRLFIVISVFALICSIFILRDKYYRDIWQLIVLNLVALFATAAFLVYGRLLFLWISDGFSNSNSGVTPSISSHGKIYADVKPEAETLAMTIEQIEAKDSELAEQESMQAAEYWPRLWARCIDLFLVMIVANLIVFLLPNIPIQPGIGAVLVDTIIWMILLSVVIVAYDKFLIQIYGTTPGKSAFGLQVRSLRGGGLLSPEQAQGRALAHLKSGLYFMIYFPVLQLIGAFQAWRKRNEPMPWDREANSIVLQKKIGQFRYLSFAIIAFVMIVSIIVSNMVVKEIRKSEVRSSSIK